MKTLSSLHLVQYSFWDFETFNLKQGGTAFLGPNGAGKTSLVDAIQVAMVGGHGNHTHFNSQSVHKDNRSIRDYALGMMRSGEGEQGVITRKRDEAISYITLVFEGDTPEDCVSAGLCIHSLATERSHRTLGLYIVPGVVLKLEDHLGALDDGGKAPLDWATFDALIRKLAKQAGRTPTLTNKPETYLDELLHALQHKGRTIDRDKFLRSLAQSLRLKGISSVNDYLRGYLVDAQPIDKQGTLKHIKTVRALIKQIEEVKQQIVRLNDIDGKFTTVANYYQTRSNANAVITQLQMESVDTRVGELEDSRLVLADSIRTLDRSIEDVTKEEAVLSASYIELHLSYSSDPALQTTEQARKLRDAYQAAIKEHKCNVDRISLEVRTALSASAETLEISENQGAKAILALAKRWDDGVMKGVIPTLQEMKEALDVLKSASIIIEALHQQNLDALGVAERQLQAATEKIKFARQGVRLHDDNVAVAMSLFSQNGIESRPVASFVKVRDIRWQPAIESVLGGNRFALVVDAGREDDAVSILRSLSKPLYDVTVVQPKHLKEQIARGADLQSVAELLVSENEVALAFLRKKLGKMRRVDSEKELGEYDRALTLDGMLSTGGGTKRIRLTPQSECALGAVVSGAEVEHLKEEFRLTSIKENDARNRHNLSKDADGKLGRVLREVTVEKYSLAVAGMNAVEASLSAVPDTDLSGLPEHLANIKTLMNAAGDGAKQANAKLLKAIDERAQSKSKLKQDGESLIEANAELGKLKQGHLQMIDDEDYDSERALAMYDRAGEIVQDEGATSALAYLQNLANLANSKLVNAETSARTEFASYINEMSINLVDERSDWRKAFKWVGNHVKKLTDSTLIEYEKEAHAARDAANQSFRADVAYRMREAIQRVKHDINDLNGILESCPEFTGGERYSFVADTSLAHKDLYELIEKSAFVETATAHMFDPASEVQKTLVNFLEACESGEGKANNPLEDYRLLFNFDLVIKVGGKEVDRLSKRLGVGSNGEHLVPFYVIAGASLANAYRIKSGEPYDGSALMIIDEAFHGFDAQNAFVTAQFLRSLGLQLVMAAPDADVGKLIPVLDSYYDLDRFGADVFTEEVLIKEPAQRLLESDMPTRNPGLVAKMVEQLSIQA